MLSYDFGITVPIETPYWKEKLVLFLFNLINKKFNKCLGNPPPPYKCDILPAYVLPPPYELNLNTNN